VVVNSNTTFTAIGHGTDSLGNDVTYDEGPPEVYPGEKDTVDVDVISPDTQISISTSAAVVQAGGTVNLTVTEDNTGGVPLGAPYVEVSPGGYTLNKASGYYTGGDTNSDGILDTDETWTWIITGVVVSSNTTFTAIGHGTDSLGGDVTYPGYSGERDTVDVTVISPGTQVSIDASVYLIYAGDTVNLTVTEDNTGTVALSAPYVEVSPGSYTLNKASGYYTGGDTNSDGILDTDETWTWIITGVVVNSDTTFTATGHGTDSLGGDVTYDNGYLDERDTVDVDTIDPDTLVTIDSDVYETIPGGNVILTITEKNTGDDPLTSVYVRVDNGSSYVDLDVTDASWTSDYNGDAILDPDETWTWTLQVTISTDTTFTATGHGIDSLGNDVTVPYYEFEQDSVSVRVEGDFTRTWGFWKTHLYLVQYALNPANGLGILPINLGDWGDGDMVIDGPCRYMGLMWTNQSNNSDGSKRTKIDAARIHTAHQALAAIMNYYMPNGATIPVSPAEIANILTNGNVKQIRDLGSQLAAYNESGEDIALDPSLPPTGKTSGNIGDPQGARDVGAPCETYWDTEPDTSRGKDHNK